MRVLTKVLMPVAGLALAILFIALATRGVDWDRLRETLIDIEIISATLALISLLVMYLVFSMRWTYILPTERSLRLSNVFPAVMIGYLFNTVTPFRLGDVARSTVLARSHGVPVGRSMGSIFAEHLFDGLLLVVVVAGFALFIPIPPVAKTAIFAGFSVGIVAGILVMALAPDRFEKLEWLVKPFGRLGERAFGIAREINLGFSSLRRGRRVLGGVVWTLAVWLLLFTYSIMLAQSFDLDVPWYAPIFALALAGLGAAIPGTPAAIGIFELAIVAGLSVWTDDATSALAYAIALHTGQLVSNILIGGVVVIRTGYLSSRRQSTRQRAASATDQ